MTDSRSAVWAPANGGGGLDDSLATAQERAGALSVCAVLLVAAACAALLGQQAGPQVKPFVLVAATVWSLADVLTAFLLIVQFYVTGKLMFGILSGAYAFSGFLTWVYLAAFPGVLNANPLTAGEQQISVYLWTIWHSTFPALVILAMASRTGARRLPSRRAVRGATVLVFVTPAIAAAVVCTSLYAYRDALPHVVNAASFAPLWKTVCIPVVLALNTLACFVLLRRKRKLSPLALWLTAALFAETLDALLNISTARYSFAWDTGKLITVFAASVVLIMILFDIAGLYGQLARLSKVDSLTSLPNRRVFEEHFEFVFNNARRLRTSIGLIFVHIDSVERYDDAHGNAARADCLRQLAAEMLRCATRPLDLVASYDRDRYAVILPDTALRGVLLIAERIQSAVEQFAVDDALVFERVSVAMGVGYSPNVRDLTKNALIAAAQGALDDAKGRGPNTVVLASTEAGVPLEQILPVPALVG